MRRLTIATLLLLGCFDWDVLSSSVIEPDLSVLDDLSVPSDLAVAPPADLSKADLSMPDLAKPDLALPVITFTKQADSTKFGGKMPNNAIFGWNTQNLTAVGDGGVVVSTTDGTNWSLVTLSGGLTQNIQDVWFSGDGSSGWFVGAGTTAYQWSSPNWQTKSAGLGGNLFGVFGTANDKVVASGDQNNKMYRYATAWANDGNTPNFASTQNGMWGTGMNFYSVSSAGGDCLVITDTAVTKVNCGTNGSLETIWGADTSNVFAAGYENNTGIVSKYNGTMWKKETIPAVGKLWSVWAAGSKDVWVGGENATLLRYDGTSWTQHSAVGIGATETIKDIWGADANNVWLLSSAGSIYKKN